MFILSVLFYDFIFGFFGGMASSMGLGGGAILILYLTSIRGLEQKNAQGISLLFMILAAVISLFIYNKKKLLNLVIILKMSLSGFVGSIIGTLFLKEINPIILRKILGLFLFIVGCVFLFRKAKK